MRLQLTLALFLFTATTLNAQQKCPADETTTVPSTITGALAYHPGVYAWYELRPSQPLCGKSAVQLVFDRAAFLDTHRLVGCTITATGNLYIPDTGYYNADLAIQNAHIQPSPSCKPGQPLPDYAAIAIPATLLHYKVSGTYDPKSQSFSAQATDTTGKLLTPWQTYVTDIGNGARDLQRMYCADGFTASAPKDPTGQPDLQANIDPDTPEAVEVTITNDTTPVHLSFTCTRSAAAPSE